MRFFFIAFLFISNFYYYTKENSEIIIAKSEEYLSRSRKWIERLNHNYLRLTRILTSLTILGWENYALALFNCLNEIYNENKKIIGLTTYNFWKNAVNTGTLQHTKPLPDLENTIVCEPAEAAS